MAQVARRIAQMRDLISSLDATLKAFNSSPSNFQLLRTIPSHRFPPSSPEPPNHSSPGLAATASPPPNKDLKTLFILDSSFNPPSRAHLALARSALLTSSAPKPHRLLLLFSTQNADKAASPAAFPERLAMLLLAAEDLQDSLRSHDRQDVHIDIGLTTAAFFTDKSVAIASEGAGVYPEGVSQLFLVGYDTLVRVLAPRYYAQYSPPLSALEPFFSSGHRIGVFLRPVDVGEAGGKEAVKAQRNFIAGLALGKLDGEGFQGEWAEQIEVLDVDEGEALGISSTVIRQMAGRRDWEGVRRLCSESVAEWVRVRALYTD